MRRNEKKEKEKREVERRETKKRETEEGYIPSRSNSRSSSSSGRSGHLVQLSICERVVM